MVRLACRGIRYDHDLWAAHERLPVPQARRTAAGRINARGDGRRSPVWQGEARMVQASVPGERGLRGRFENRAAAFSSVPRVLETFGRSGRLRCELRTARSNQDDAGKFGLSYVRPLQWAPGAIRLAWRKPSSDIVFGSGRMATRWDTILIVPVLLGLVPTALHWTASGVFQSIRQWLVELCVDRSWSWPLSLRIPWWFLTNYPSVNDVMNFVDAVSFLVLACLGALAATVAFVLPLAAAAAILRRPSRIVHHLAQAFIPLASVAFLRPPCADHEPARLGWRSSSRSRCEPRSSSRYLRRMVVGAVFQDWGRL